MAKLNETYCLAILVTNLKQRKRYPDPITVADCAKYLVDMYGAFEQVSKMVGVDPSVIKKWVNLAGAPDELRQYVKEGKIYPVAAFAILSAFSDDSKRIEVAKEVAGWGEPEIIRLIRHMKRTPGLTALEGKNLVMAEALRELVTNQKEVTEGKEDQHP